MRDTAENDVIRTLRISGRLVVRRDKVWSSSGCKSHPANSVAPAGSYRSGGGGNEAAGAFEKNGSCKRLGEFAGRNASERRAGLESANVEADPPVNRGRPQLLGNGGSRLAKRQEPAVPPG